MDGTQTLVGLGAVGLLAANEWTGPDRGLFGGVLWNGKDATQAHKAMVRLLGELLFVVVLVVLAGLNGSWPTLVAVTVAALWVLFLINRNTKKA